MERLLPELILPSSSSVERLVMLLLVSISSPESVLASLVTVVVGEEWPDIGGDEESWREAWLEW